MRNILLAIIFLILFTSCEKIPEPYYIDAVFIMDDDGSNVIHMIDGMPGSVQFTPNDEKIIGVGSGIWSINLDGSELKYLVDSLCIDVSLPSFSPDSTKITFAAGDIYIMDIDGTNLQNLTKTSDVRDRYPHFSLDGDSIVYATDSDSETTISIMDTNGENTRKLISTSTEPYPCYYYYPRYNISGDKIYYKYLGEQRGLYSINTNGANNNLLFEGHLESYFLSMPDDGSKLVFSCNSRVYIMNTANYEVTDLGEGHTAMISSNGSKIVFIFNGVQIMNSDGSEKTNLGYGHKPRFSWNPIADGYKIVFVARRQIDKKRNKNIVF